MIVLIDLPIIKFTCQHHVSGYVCRVWHLFVWGFFSPVDWNNFYCKTFDHCTLFLSWNMRNKHLATFTQNLKVIKTTFFFPPIYFVGAPVFLPQHWKLLGPERLMPLKLLGMNRVREHVQFYPLHCLVNLSCASVLHGRTLRLWW